MFANLRQKLGRGRLANRTANKRSRTDQRRPGFLTGCGTKNACSDVLMSMAKLKSPVVAVGSPPSDTTKPQVTGLRFVLFVSLVIGVSSATGFKGCCSRVQGRPGWLGSPVAGN